MMNRKITLVPTEEAMLPVQSMIEEAMDEAMVPMKISMKIGIVVDEVFSNIIRYSEAKNAEVSCSIGDGVLELTFVDDGLPYNPLEAKEPDLTATAEERDIGGLGILITKRMMDQMTYKYEDGKNKLKLRKNI